MSRSRTALRRVDFRSADGVLLILRDPPPAAPPVSGQPPAVPANPAEGKEILLALWDDASVTALHGHVDLGTGIRTALAQVVAEELDLAMERIEMVLGDTTRAPNQGPTIASSTMQIHALPLRRAAAQARAWLLERAAQRLGVDASQLETGNGRVRIRDEIARSVGYGELVAGAHVELELATEVPLKSPDDYRVVGTSVPRVDIPAKATGETVFVHDLRLPGMLHGRVIRPPWSGADHGEFIGHSLESVDRESIAHVPGVVAIVVIRDFVGVVAEREEQAERAMRELRVRWKPFPALPALDDLAEAIRANPSTRRVVAEHGDVDAVLAAAAIPMQRSYVWPYQMHASIGPSCALADYRQGEAGDSLAVWSGTQNPYALRLDLAKLTGLSDTAIDVIRMEASGCYGRNCADDVAADATLLSRAVGRPVRVQLTREQEHLWEPKGAAQLMEVSGGLTAEGTVAGYDFQTSYPSNGAVTLALLLTGVEPARPVTYEMGDRTSVPPYRFDALRVSINDMAPILRASWLRGVSALPNSFAHESFIDELASAAGVDPVEFRLRYLDDPRARDLVLATARRAGWQAHTRPQQQPPEGEWLKGQGFAYARYVHSRFPGFGAAWAAWVADVEVNPGTGEVHVSRVVVGHDAGMMVNPAGVRHQIHGNVVQTTSRALKEQVRTDAQTGVVASREWGSYPILDFREVPVIEVMMMPRQGEPPQGVGESASVPGTAAIANAIFDATGVRFRQPPFTPEVVRAALAPAPSLPAPPAPARRSFWGRAGALLAAVVGIGAAAIGWKPAIAPVSRPDPSIWTAEVIERGRQLAAAGDCAVCHTAPGGVRHAGGRALPTPFGVVVSTNLTPDPQTGIGNWSLSAFQRAMREGISRDGSHLYPAFPYTAFTRVTDDDLTALYAYLMSQPAVTAPAPPSQLAFPFSVRPLMAVWNALYLVPGPQPATPERSQLWNRGEYLVNGLGHCSACHTPRDALGAEKRDRHWMSGAMIDGWEAPALNASSRSPVRWSEQDYYDYLRSGVSERHGMAAGPMADVVRELSALPDADVRAMAHYLGSLSPGGDPVRAVVEARAAVATATARAPALTGAAQRQFDRACGACHHDGDGPVEVGRNLPLALSSKLHSDRPDNLVRVILEGIRDPVSYEVGYMPAFADSLDDAQVAAMVGWMRQRFAPGRDAWRGIDAAVARIRADRTAGR